MNVNIRAVNALWVVSRWFLLLSVDVLLDKPVFFKEFCLLLKMLYIFHTFNVAFHSLYSMTHASGNRLFWGAQYFSMV